MTHPADDVRLSKFLSLVLRHNPGKIGLILDPQGWCAVDELIARSASHGMVYDRTRLQQVVAGNDKQRFTLSPDGLRIRAAQGHTVEVQLGLLPTTPPELLYHGTTGRFVASILAEGLKPMSRLQVHLSVDIATALRVGSRRGPPVILEVAAARMHADGLKFFRADNGVWLTDLVPPAYLALGGTPPA